MKSSGSAAAPPPISPPSPSSSSSSSVGDHPHDVDPLPPPPSRLTVTQVEQLKVEEKVFEIYQMFGSVGREAQSVIVIEELLQKILAYSIQKVFCRLEIWRDRHIAFLTRGLKQLGPRFHVLDSSRPWICYWILHSITLLGECLDPELENNMVDFLSRCQDKDGGYGGGPGQLPHLATTYAAVNSLISLGSDTALASIKRDNMHNFIIRMKDSSGAFRMHEAGEIDVRACYTAISVASVLNILDYELVKDVGEYILRCQTYEGGIAGEPGSEAHGGYTFCGLATMILINQADKLDLHSLIGWIASRQGVECGFQGRTNKLVDGCYSFWQGGALALVERLLPMINKNVAVADSDEIEAQTSERETQGMTADVGLTFIRTHPECGPLFHNIALQQYILLCSQVLEGGFKDKPGKHRDFYHSCYCLSGLSASQYSYSKDAAGPPLPNAVLGPYSNLLEPIHPLYNVCLDKYYRAHDYFSSSRH